MHTHAMHACIHATCCLILARWPGKYMAHAKHLHAPTQRAHCTHVQHTHMHTARMHTHTAPTHARQLLTHLTTRTQHACVLIFACRSGRTLQAPGLGSSGYTASFSSQPALSTVFCRCAAPMTWHGCMRPTNDVAWMHACRAPNACKLSLKLFNGAC